MSNPPILYSFRRCPYAIRARLAIAASATTVELREVVLKDKPAEMLASSPKGTVPVLVLASGQVIDESLDIMLWALSQADPEQWLPAAESSHRDEVFELITNNDGAFKAALDRYKYADRYPEHSSEYYRDQACLYLQPLEQRLSRQRYLTAQTVSLADVAIWPFVRQFAHVDKAWFDSTELPGLQRWLAEFLDSPMFAAVMKKYPAWSADQSPLLFA